MLYHGNLHPKSFHRFVSMWSPSDTRAGHPTRSTLDRVALVIALACTIGLTIGLSLT
jgi:hypothetical protein